MDTRDVLARWVVDIPVPEDLGASASLPPGRRLQGRTPVPREGEGTGRARRARRGVEPKALPSPGFGPSGRADPSRAPSPDAGPPHPWGLREHLARARRWEAQLASGQVASRADVARAEGLTRARVTQVMNLLKLAPEILAVMEAAPEQVAILGERAIRDLVQVGSPERQVERFRLLLARRPGPGGSGPSRRAEDGAVPG